MCNAMPAPKPNAAPPTSASLQIGWRETPFGHEAAVNRWPPPGRQGRGFSPMRRASARVNAFGSSSGAP